MNFVVVFVCETTRCRWKRGPHVLNGRAGSCDDACVMVELCDHVQRPSLQTLPQFTKLCFQRLNATIQVGFGQGRNWMNAKNDGGVGVSEVCE